MQDAMERLRIPDYSHHGPSNAVSRTYGRPASAQSEVRELQELFSITGFCFEMYLNLAKVYFLP